MNYGDILEMNDTRLEIVEVSPARTCVRVRYLAPIRSLPVGEWYGIEYLLAHGWRVIPQVEAPPCMDV